MHRRMTTHRLALRALALSTLFASMSLHGCSNDGYGGKDYGQEFEKPADMPKGDGAPPPESLKRDKAD